MNILYIIGNGFDINLKLKTSYQDFYDYYIALPSTSASIERLKSYLTKERFGVWSDLEMGLGDYTSQIETIEELEEICHDLSSNLKVYLKTIQDTFLPKPQEPQKMFEFLYSPQAGLLEGKARALGGFVNDGKHRRVDVISFNYTNIFETICGYKGNRIPFNNSFDLQSIRHIHLSLNNIDVIMGVNDESQISNKAIINPEVLDLLVKPHINEQLGTMIDVECRSLINQADVICLFGVSLGETDKIWWQEIGKNMIDSQKRLVYYVYDKDNPQYNNQLIGKQRHYLNVLLKKCNLPQDRKTITDRIFVGYKTSFFRFR